MKKSIVKIALTGGIASGKSTISALLETLGMSVIDLDELSKEVTQVNSQGLIALTKIFGKRIVDINGNLNRAILKKELFAKVENKMIIESILHPLIIELMHQKIQQLSRQSLPYVLVVVPLLLEANMQALFDKIIVINCPIDKQKERLKQRDNLSSDMIDQILSNQATNQQKLAIKDCLVINNKGDFKQLKKAVDELYQQLVLLPKADKL